jgi:hypothetical protein
MERLSLWPRPTTTLPRAALERLRASTPEMARQMEEAILTEVPRYTANPDLYREAVLQRCRLATRLFVRILETGSPPADRDVRVVQGIARNIAVVGEPLEPLLHALRIGARVGWDETLKAGLDDPDVRPETLLPLAGQVFEYIDQLSSRIAEAYARQVEEIARAQAISQSALFEDLISGRSADPLAPGSPPPPTVALSMAMAADDSAAHGVAETTAGRLRTRFPGAVAGQRQGLPVWLLERDPLPAQLLDCAGSADVVFGVATAGEDLPLGRAVEEAATAARVAADLGLAPPPARAFSLADVYAYAAMRANPAALARSREALLARLDDHPALLETLRAYFASNRSVSATALLVHRHRQSVIYRLRRIAKLLEVSFDDAEALFRLEAAVRTSPNGPGSG